VTRFAAYCGTCHRGAVAGESIGVSIDCDAFSVTGEDFDEIRQVVAGNEVLNFLSGLSEAHFSRQMALLADRIAKTGSEFPRVYESRVVGRRAVASDALDSRHDLGITIGITNHQRLLVDRV